MTSVWLDYGPAASRSKAPNKRWEETFGSGENGRRDIGADEEEGRGRREGERGSVMDTEIEREGG